MFRDLFSRILTAVKDGDVFGALGAVGELASLIAQQPAPAAAAPSKSRPP